MLRASFSTLNIVIRGLQLVSVPMFSCLRKLVVVFIVIYEYFTIGKVADKETVMSIVVVAFSTIIAGWDTLNDQFMGYFFTMLNNVLSAATQVSVSSTLACLPLPIGCLIVSNFPDLRRCNN